MKRTKRSYTLMEILLSLLIFSVAAWICLSLFGEGAKASRRAEELSNAPLIAASALERVRAGDLPDCAVYIDTSEGYAVRFFYDYHWQPIDASQPGRALDELGYETFSDYYCLDVKVTCEKHLRRAEAAIYDAADMGEVYTLTTSWLSGEVVG